MKGPDAENPAEPKDPPGPKPKPIDPAPVPLFANSNEIRSISPRLVNMRLGGTSSMRSKENVPVALDGKGGPLPQGFALDTKVA